MEARNVTLSLPADLVQQAELYAQEHKTTVDTLVRDLLEETAAETRLARYRKAAGRLLALAERGPYSDVDPASISRDEMHERR